MPFKLRIRSGTGHEEHTDSVAEDWSEVEFETEAERSAFVMGVNMTREVMDGWVDAWIETADEEVNSG